MEPYGITIFCDDIRSEILGKTTIIGIYGHELLLFSDFPAALPKLGMFVQLRFEPEAISSLKIMVYASWIDGNVPIFTKDFPPLSEEVAKAPLETDDKDIAPTMSINFPIILSPVLLPSEGRIKVRVEINGRIVKAGTLKITKSAAPPGNG